MASHETHPDRIAARDAGERHWLGPPCPHHGDQPRFVSSGGCVVCGRESSRKYSRRRTALLAPYRMARQAAIALRKAEEAERRARPNIPDHPARLAALAAGDRTWLGPPCRHGHGGLRYTTKACACVECRRTPNGGDHKDG